MLHWFKFHAGVRAPVPAQDVYRKRPPGRGHPEECPPLRAACGYGFDVLTSFPLTFIRDDANGGWILEKPISVSADWAWAPDENGAAPPQSQVNAWFWERGQTVPHVITDDVFDTLRNQVKLCTWLFLKTDPGELLYIGDIPNRFRPWRAYSAIVDADLYPASYAWHCVLELDRREERIHIPEGEPICRIMTVPRGEFVAAEMDGEAFGEYFAAGQKWLADNAKPGAEELSDITGRYARLAKRSSFSVRPQG
ncbi:MAG: hypothetical protein EXS14_03085 [Planctomycetes bacterium]|nr:hypothetical protein [Planctomycetota bacterium]